jgi:hypothetical protein
VVQTDIYLWSAQLHTCGAHSDLLEAKGAERMLHLAGCLCVKADICGPHYDQVCSA